MDPDQVPDVGALIAAARVGDRDAWGRLCRVHAPRLTAYLGARLRRPDVVEQLVADTIVAAWAQLPELPSAEEFPAWFRRIGANLAMKWGSEHPGEPLKEPFPADRCADDEVALARMRRLEEAFGRLSKPERMALEQRFRGGLDGPLLDEALHLGPDGGREVVERALESLRRELGS
ncbi:MAG: hypothetical protein H0V44_18375 [Planctomycetes bacterium]|nr:hypothetical protein [Planctomycetota bacterium]